MIERSARSLLEDAARRFSDAGVEGPRRSAEWLLCDVLATTRAGLYANPSAPVSTERASSFERMVRRRLEHEPIQYILGHADFFGLRLQVTPDVLIPRPETEELVASVLECLDGRRAPRVLDVGTGSGCIALAVRRARPDAIVYACDVSDAALEVARQNAEANDILVDFFQADVLSEHFPRVAPRELDLLVSNPPYVAETEQGSLPEDVRAYEPHLALFAREDPNVFYHHLSRHGSAVLKEGGWLVFETHSERAVDVTRILSEMGYVDVNLRRDLAGRDRIVLGRRGPEA